MVNIASTVPLTRARARLPNTALLAILGLLTKPFHWSGSDVLACGGSPGCDALKYRAEIAGHGWPGHKTGNAVVKGCG